MCFSEGLRTTWTHIKWSPNGKYIAIPVTARLEFRDGESFQLLYSVNCTDIIQYIEWSPNSQLVLTSCIKKGIIQIWQPQNPKWKCKIDEGAAGLLKVSWSPDSLHILTTADFHIRMTVWSLANQSVSYIRNPKEANPGYIFSHSGEYLACAERRDCKDSISILETQSWHLVKSFEIGTQDLAGIAFNHDDSVLACWDSPAQYRIMIYMLSGQCLASFSAYQWALGVKSVLWSPGSQILAIKSYDQKIRVMNDVTWSIICELEHSSMIVSDQCIVLKEIEEPLTGYPATLADVKGLPTILDTHYEEEPSRPLKLLIPDPMITWKKELKFLEFSFDGRYLSSIVEAMPSVVWIWNMTSVNLVTVLIHTNPVKDMQWSPQQSYLAICCGGSSTYIWTPFGSLVVPIPNSVGVQASNLKWHPKRCKILLIGKEEFTSYEVTPQLQCDPNFECSGSSIIG